MSVHFHEGRYKKLLEVFDENKASLLLSLISEYDDAGSKLSDQDRTRLEDLKSKYRQLKYELDMKAGKGEEYEDVTEKFKMTKTDIDNLIKREDDGRKQDVVKVPYKEMIEFVKKKIGIALFYAGEYERLKEGDSSKSLHTICMWNGGVTGHVADDELKHGRPYKSTKMFSFEGILISESKEDVLERREDEKTFLKKVGEFIPTILESLKKRNAGFHLPNRLMIVPHYALNKVRFCTVAVRTQFDEYSGVYSRRCIPRRNMDGAEYIHCSPNRSE